MSRDGWARPIADPKWNALPHQEAARQQFTQHSTEPITSQGENL
jgi:hypothetical protein